MDTLKSWRGILERNKDGYQSYVDGWESRIGSFLACDLARPPSKGEGPLAGIPFAVKDNIAVKDFGLTCGSKILEPLVSPYTATAVQKLEAAGATVVAKANLDEFGMGSSTDNSALGQSNNPWDQNAVCGGSSGGSAAAVAAGLVPFSLGSDTGGSIRQPASFCGCYGLKPTYGSVSRFGLVAYASSLEVIGPFARDVDTLETVYDVMAGRDEQDQTSLARPEVAPSREAKTIGVLKQVSGLSPRVEQNYNNTITALKEAGFDVVEVDVPAIEYVVPAYYTIATAEASANLARYTGIRYGTREESESQEQMVAATRNAGFGDEVKLRILLGTYVLRSGFQDQYYVRAQKIRTAIRNGFSDAFDKVDLIMSPVFPTQAFRRGDEELSPYAQKMADKFTTIANLAGIPAMAFPTGVVDGLPVGMQFMAPPFCEHRMFDAARKLEDVGDQMKPAGYDEGWRE